MFWSGAVVDDDEFKLGAAADGSWITCRPVQTHAADGKVQSIKHNPKFTEDWDGRSAVHQVIFPSQYGDIIHITYIQILANCTDGSVKVPESARCADLAPPICPT